jgi:hypothetical protein
MSSVAQRLLTADEFWLLPGSKHQELVRGVVVHTGDGLTRTYAEEDVIEYPDVLLGFSCKVSELFV